MRTASDVRRSPSECSFRRDDEVALKVVHDSEEQAKSAGKVKLLSWYVTKRMRVAIIVGVTLVVLLIVALLLVFVGGKAYAQKHANRVEVSMNYIDLKYVEPNVDTRTLDVEFSVHMKHDGPLDATLDPVTAYLSFDGKQFGSVGIPEQTFESGPQEYDVVVRANADISDLEVLSTMSKDVVRNADVVLRASAEGTVHAWGLTYSGIDVNRALTVKGFKNFVEPQPIINTILMKKCVGNTYLITINASIDNISQLGLGGIGPLNMTVYYGQSFLGYAVSVDSDIGLPRGLSAQEFEISVPVTPAVMPTLVQMGLAVLGGQTAEFFITGENPLATQVNMLKDAVRNINMSVIYNQGLKKVSFGDQCSMTDLIAASGVTFP